MRRNQKGFSVLIVCVVLAMAAVVAVTLLDIVRVDLTLAGNSRSNAETMIAAEGAAVELLEDSQLSAMLPGFETATLAAAYDPPPGSPYVLTVDGNKYTANIELLRFAPISESSASWSRGIVYEITTTAAQQHGEANREVKVLARKTVAVPIGTVFPRRHAH
jgi:hypothetical protein